MNNTRLDHDRLMVEPTQRGRIYRALAGGAALSLPEIHHATSEPVASISAVLRQLRQAGFKIGKQLRSRGLYQYQLQTGERNDAADA